MPALARLALVLFVANAWEEIQGISVPTGKLTPITPAKVTPRPTYHPPAAAPAPVHEYTFDNPEPAPLNPSWVPVPVKYLNVLRANSILYVPVRIPNPAARNYYNMALKEQPAATTEATTYQNQDTAVYQTQQSNSAVYQTQQPTAAVYQTQQPTAAVYQAQQPTTYQAQQPNTGVYQAQQVNNAVYQSQQAVPVVYQSQPTNAPVAQTTYQSVEASTASTYQKESDNGKENEQVPEFGAKIAPKQKYNKPYYYLPKSQYGKQATKGGYPKKAIAAPSQKYYFYYPVPTNAQ